MNGLTKLALPGLELKFLNALRSGAAKPLDIQGGGGTKQSGSPRH
jgi:hypothetical protein